MNLKQLEYFRTTAELEHFTRAAELLGISQSSLSHSIKELEEELGVKLFQRQGRNVKLTKYGQMFLPSVTQSLDALSDGCQQVKDSVNPDGGTVHIALPARLEPFASYLAVYYVSETGRSHVNFQFTRTSSCADARHKLLESTVDLVFLPEAGNDLFDSFRIGSHEIVVLVSQNHRLAGRKSVTLAELRGERFLYYPRRHPFRRTLDSAFAEVGFTPSITAETAQDHAIFGMVAANRGVAIMPRPLGDMPYPIKILPITGTPPAPRQIYLLWNRRTSLPPAALRLRDFILQRGPVFDEYLHCTHQE